MRSSIEKKRHGYGRKWFETLLGEKDFWEREKERRER